MMGILKKLEYLIFKKKMDICTLKKLLSSKVPIKFNRNHLEI